MRAAPCSRHGAQQVDARAQPLQGQAARLRLPGRQVPRVPAARTDHPGRQGEVGGREGGRVSELRACLRPDPDVTPACAFSLNFKDPEAVRALTCTLLKEDFGLTIDIPLERLIPTVPLRLNYIHWVEDLIGHQDADKRVLRRGIDIGIYCELFIRRSA